MLMPRPRALIAAALAVTAALLAVAPPGLADAKKSPKLGVDVLSSRPDEVTGENALIGVQVPSGVKVAKVRVRRNGHNVTSAFTPSASDPRQLIGLVQGLNEGPNHVTAYAKGLKRATDLVIYDTAINGPVFSGPHQTPFFCTTVDNDLGNPTDADCSAPTQVQYRYRSTGGGFKPLADPTSRPPDLAQTTTRDGQTVDYVVRIESGVINRSIYRWAILAPGGQIGTGWNGRFIYFFGGGCSAGYQQGKSSLGSVLDDRQLSEGYSIMSGSLTVLNTSCNDVLSAETASMIKEHAIETLGQPPVWTLGDGGSGGSIQQQMIAQNYPGLLDGLMPGMSFPDSAMSKNPDCRLMQAYFQTPDGSALSDAQMAAIDGFEHGSTGCIASGTGADVVNATEGCDESVVPPAQIFNPVSNPGGIRCTIWDSMVNVYGRDPNTGYARRTLDNVGIQYGLNALASGAISVKEFLDLNDQIGGFDDNGIARPQRSVADADALAIAYKTGRVNQGMGGVPNVPIVDVRDYSDDDATNVHQYISTYQFRQRLLDTNGTYANQVMLRAEGGGNTNKMRDAALDMAGDWLDRIAADKSDKPLAQKVIDDKPADAVDACWIGGQRINDPALIGDTGQCSTTYPPHSVPDLEAGKPLGSITAKCQLSPIDVSDYPSMNANQQTRMSSIFPDGVCDWSRAGVGEQPISGTWQSFGPDHRVKANKRRLKLKASPRRPAAGRRATLTARLRPCPAVTWQPVTLERKRKGKWKSVETKLVEGGKCKAHFKYRAKRPTKLRLTAKAGGGFAGAHSKKLKLG